MRVAIIGTFQVGKSTLVNCLLDQALAIVGMGVPTTHLLCHYKKKRAGLPRNLLFYDSRGIELGNPVRFSTSVLRRIGKILPEKTIKICFELDDLGWLEKFEIIDTPGLDAIGEMAATDEKLTTKAIAHSDCHILVVPNTQLASSVIHELLPKIKDTNKPIVCVMNCCASRVSPDPNAQCNMETAIDIGHQLQDSGVLPCAMRLNNDTIRVLPCNLSWYWVSRKQAIEHKIVNQQTNEMYEVLCARVADWFSRGGRKRPSNEILAKQSNFDVLTSFFNGQTLDVLNIENYVLLGNAISRYRKKITKVLSSWQRRV